MESNSKENTMLDLHWLRWASLAEGATLILLVCLAVPLKRMAGMPEFVTVLGPLHGGAFVIFTLMVLRAGSVGLLAAREALQLMVVTFIPFGAFFASGLFRLKATALALPDSNAPSIPN